MSTGDDGSPKDLSTAIDASLDEGYEWDWLTGWPVEGIQVSPFSLSRPDVIAGVNPATEGPFTRENGWELYSRSLGPSENNAIRTFSLYNRFTAQLVLFAHVGEILKTEEFAAKTWRFFVKPQILGGGTARFLSQSMGSLSNAYDLDGVALSEQINIPEGMTPVWVAKKITINYDPNLAGRQIRISMYMQKSVEGIVTASGTYCGLISNSFQIAKSGVGCAEVPALEKKSNAIYESISSFTSLAGDVNRYSGVVAKKVGQAADFGYELLESEYKVGNYFDQLNENALTVLQLHGIPVSGRSWRSTYAALLTGNSANISGYAATINSLTAKLLPFLPFVQSAAGMIFSTSQPPPPPTIFYQAGAIQLAGTLRLDGNPKTSEQKGLSGSGYDYNYGTIPFYAKSQSSRAEPSRYNTPLGLLWSKKKPKALLFVEYESYSRQYYWERDVRRAWLAIEPPSEWLGVNPHTEVPMSFGEAEDDVVTSKFLSPQDVAVPRRKVIEVQVDYVPGSCIYYGEQGDDCVEAEMHPSLTSLSARIPLEWRYWIDPKTNSVKHMHTFHMPSVEFDVTVVEFPGHAYSESYMRTFAPWILPAPVETRKISPLL